MNLKTQGRNMSKVAQLSLPVCVLYFLSLHLFCIFVFCLLLKHIDSSQPVSSITFSFFLCLLHLRLPSSETSLCFFQFPLILQIHFLLFTKAKIVVWLQSAVQSFKLILTHLHRGAWKVAAGVKVEYTTSGPHKWNVLISRAWLGVTVRCFAMWALLPLA